MTEAAERKVDVTRLMRRIVFERLLVRFAFYEPGLWVLKGGVAVEVRLNDRARATKDLDLALRHPDAATASHVQELLVEALLSDPQQDFFQFRITRFRTMNIGNPFGDVWRASVDAHLDGRTFDRERPSTRVKDLADLILFIEYGLAPTPELGMVVNSVFTARGSDVPRELPQPPESWGPRYEELAGQLGLVATTLNAAMAALRSFWAAASKY